MPGLDPAVLELFAGLDRFVQWDLVTVTPWGAPAISPVGARLVPQEATIWTSTTVGYATKVRNIQIHPRVALMRVRADEPSILIRGEARVVAGDGTLNLAQLFRLMGGAGGARSFFATSVKDPFWSRLYRSYWHRYLIAIRIVEISRMGPDGWVTRKVGRWSPTHHVEAPRGKRRRSIREPGLLNNRGRALLQAGVPAAFASVESDADCPRIWPVRATVEKGGGIQVDSDVPLPEGRLPHSSLALRVIDDTFEVAQMVGWIGTLEPGQAGRHFETRRPYGFTKPPGVVGDLAAGVAALVQDRLRGDLPQVSPPDLSLALELGGAETAPRPQLSEAAWTLLEQIFARRNAAAPWYTGMALVVPDRQLKKSLTSLAYRAQVERDWAHGLLTRGSRRVGASRLAAGAIAFRPNPAAARTTAVREELVTGRLLERVAAQLPAGESAPPPRVDAASRARSGGKTDLGLAAAASVAAALDRWQERSG